jgi:hypothetical protein
MFITLVHLIIWITSFMINLIKYLVQRGVVGFMVGVVEYSGSSGI